MPSCTAAFKAHCISDTFLIQMSIIGTDIGSNRFYYFTIYHLGLVGLGMIYRIIKQVRYSIFVDQIPEYLEMNH